ncbi:MAG: alpha/beta hydrolase, partial [Clostridia bacterium]|nr:alpha/beta hydrolase [Clostridia bacterium]
MVIFIVVLVLLVLLMALGFVLAKYALSIRRQTLEEARKWQSEHYDISFFDKLKKEDYTVESYDGYQLHVHFLHNPASSQRYVLLSHGYTDNHLGSLKYTQMYLDLGFNVILYDLRGHGENAPTFCSYSIREGHDLAVLIEDCRRRYGDNVFFG